MQDSYHQPYKRLITTNQYEHPLKLPWFFYYTFPLSTTLPIQAPTLPPPELLALTGLQMLGLELRHCSTPWPEAHRLRR